MKIKKLTLLLAILAVQAVHVHSAPNIIVVFIDDMGWGDFSCFGNKDAHTPHIDSLARNGIRFEQFYVNSPICSPSRTALSTGQYPQRWKITSYLSNRKHNAERGMAQWLDPQAPMLARSLNKAGYATGHFGKWHMGGQRDVNDAPAITDYGFDESLTNFEGMGPKLLPLTMRPGAEKPGRIWAKAEILGDGVRWMQRSRITEGFVDAAIPFIKNAIQNDKPFYVNLWPDDVHSPFWPPVDKWGDGSKRQLYLSVLEEMDKQLGKLFSYIESDESLRNNTLILACSDNGPELGAGVAGPFKGFKTHLYEGGIRSSLIAWGPGILTRMNYVNRDSVFSAIDLVPTLIDLAGANPAENTRYDGEIVTDILLGKSEGSREAPLYFRRPPDRDSFYGVNDLPDLAVRHLQWKFMCEFDGSQPELYNILTDKGESNNLADNQDFRPVVDIYQSLVTSWNSTMPQDNEPKLTSKKK